MKTRLLKATCTKMCPAKEIDERRKTKHTISVFEMTNGQLDPKLAVKRHHKAAADKSYESSDIRTPETLAVSSNTTLTKKIKTQKKKKKIKKN